VGALLEGKVAVITGGATGIGLAAAKRFIEEGAFVFIFGRRQEALNAAVAELGPNARAVKGSVSDLADLDRLYAAVKAERGTLDIVFANAGTGGPIPLGKLTAEHIDETFDTNVKGTIFTVQNALPLMGKGGSIILTGSSAGTTGAPAFSVYSASKAAVRNLARTWAEDLKGTGIRVTGASQRFLCRFENYRNIFRVIAHAQDNTSSEPGIILECHIVRRETRKADLPVCNTDEGAARIGQHCETDAHSPALPVCRPCRMLF
jgi:NAD(P)-dependent dehydrogenase (short-subunit alcohol dehydrogenase family)